MWGMELRIMELILPSLLLRRHILKKPATIQMMRSLSLASKGPLWFRALSLSVLLVLTGKPWVDKGMDMLDERSTNNRFKSTTTFMPSSKSATGSTTPVYGDGKQVKAPANDAANDSGLDANDERELAKHFLKEELPPYKRLKVSDKNDDLAYTYFPSDGCVLIKHMKNGVIKSDLVRAAPPPTSARSDQPQEGTSRNADLWLDGKIHLPPTFLHVSEERTANATVNEDHGHGEEQGYCLNPHPGQFVWWTGQPLDQCWIPIFRKFNDGCTHYQLQNRCNGEWNPAINWTYCNAQHF